MRKAPPRRRGGPPPPEQSAADSEHGSFSAHGLSRMRRQMDEFDDLPPEVVQKNGGKSDHSEMLPGTLKALQKEQVLKMLESTHGNKERAARLLGISRRTLYRLLDRYGLGKNGHASETDMPDVTSS